MFVTRSAFLNIIAKLEVESPPDSGEAAGGFELMYKRGLSAKTPPLLSNSRDVLVCDSKIRTALSKLDGGVAFAPPELLVTGMGAGARNDLAISRLVLWYALVDRQRRCRLL